MADGGTSLDAHEVAINILDLPLEVLADQIFKFLCFAKCITTLSYVCKHFDRAIQSANFQKQIRLDVNQPNHLHYSSKVLSKYQIDTLILKTPGSSLQSISKIIRASPRLQTLVICEIPNNTLGFIDLDSSKSILDQINKTPSKFNPLFEHITTLSIPSNSLALLQLFPRVSQLKLAGPYIRGIDVCFPSVKELEIESCSAEDLLQIKATYPALRVAYILPVDKRAKNDDSGDTSSEESQADGNSADLDQEDESNESELDRETLDQKYNRLEDIGNDIDVIVKCRYSHLKVDGDFRLTDLSCHEYFNAFGSTPLGYFLEKSDEAEYLRLFSINTSEYERSFFDRDPLFRFPQLAPTFDFDVMQVAYYTSNDPQIYQHLVDNGWVSFWSLLARDCQQAVQRFQELPIPARIHRGDPGELLLTLFMNVPFDQILSKIDEATLTKLLALRGSQQFSFVHVYAESPIELDIGPIIKLIDVHALEADDRNAATVAMNNKNFAKWLELLKLGCGKQWGKYEHLVDLILSDFFSEKYSEIYEVLGSKSLLMYIPIVNMNEDGVKAIDRLVSFGEDINQSCAGGSSFFIGVTAVEPSSNGNIFLKHLLNNYDIDINHIAPSGRTALTTAINFDQLEKIELLLMYGADPNIGGIDLVPIFQICKGVKSIEFIQCINILLDYGVDINSLEYDKFGRRVSPLAMAIMCGQPLHHIQFMIDRGAKADFIDENGNNLIHYALLSNDSRHMIQCIKFVSKHCDINKRNNIGMAPFHVSLEGDYDLEVCNALIESGADVNLPSEDGTSPLGWALWGNPYTLQYFVQKDNVDIRSRDTFGRTCFCFMNRKTADALLDMLTDDDFKKNFTKYATPENIAFAIAELKDIFAKKNSTVDVLAIERFFTYHVSFTKFLIEDVGVDPNWVDSDEDNLLRVINFVSGRSEDVIDYLLSKGLNINHKNSNGNTVLHATFESNTYSYDDMKERQWLLKRGADPFIKNNEGISPADIEPNWKNFLVDEIKLSGFRQLRRIDLMEIRKIGKIVLKQKRQKTSN